MLARSVAHEHAADRVLLAGTLGRGAWTLTFGTTAAAPQIQIPGIVAFGDACVGSSRQATLNVCNTGKADLVIDPIASSNPRFKVTTPSAGYPIVIRPDFVSRFAGAATFPDVSAWSVLGTIKYTFNPPATVRVFVNGGAGLYQFDPGDAEFGFNIGAGVQIPLNRRFAVEGTYNYNHALTASPNRRFSQIQGGVLIYF
jgi:opacity protein-like surface antigen